MQSTQQKYISHQHFFLLLLLIHHLHHHPIPHRVHKHLPPLHQQKVQPSIPGHQKHTTNHPEPGHIVPKRQHIKPETAQDRTPGDFDVEPVLLVHE